jgi:hypothetical protein
MWLCFNISSLLAIKKNDNENENFLEVYDVPGSIQKHFPFTVLFNPHENSTR